MGAFSVSTFRELFNTILLSFEKMVKFGDIHHSKNKNRALLQGVEDILHTLNTLHFEKKMNLLEYTQESIQRSEERKSSSR